MEVLGRSRDDLTTGIESGLAENDTDRDGKVTRRQMMDALEAMNLNPEHIRMCMAGVDEDEKGKVTIADGCVANIVSTLVKIEKQIQLDAERSKPPPLSRRLLDAFTASDSEGHGLLQTSAVKDVLREMGLGLKERHVITIISAAEKKDDMINYGAFAKYAADVIEDIAGKDADVKVEPTFAPVVNEYRSACREVASIEKSDLYHLRSLTHKTAPVGIVKVLGLIGELLGEKCGEDFHKQKELLARSDFLGAVAGVDPRLLDDAQLAMVKNIVDCPECGPDQISRPSTSQYTAAVIMARWLIKLEAEVRKIKAES